MTLTEKMTEQLTQHGIWPQQAVAVIEIAKAAKENEAMASRWNDDIGDYPEIMIRVMWLSVKRHALAYIDAECPQAWFRPMFCDDPDAELARLANAAQER